MKQAEMKMDLSELSATAAASAIRSGALTSATLTQALLDRIEGMESHIGAWTYLDADRAMEQAEAADHAMRQGKIKSALHGIPIGVKDIFDTKDMPTECGTSIYSGRRPAQDCTVVSILRKAGMVILGKTVTTELASYSPGKTRNPCDPERTPGGSSSGSAAAVACRMVPLATGSQTYGSITRPASFCGVYGYKPTYGAISRCGVLRQSRQLDHIGVFARNLEDAAAVGSLLMQFDVQDPDLLPERSLQQIARKLDSLPSCPRPRFAFARTALWKRVSVSARSAFEETVAALGDSAHEIKLADCFDKAEEILVTIMEADMARNYAKEYERSRDELSPMIRQMIERGQRCTDDAFGAAVHQALLLNDELAKVFERHDAILTPATCGVAPRGLDRTGDPAPCAIWTLCRVPSLCLPLLRGEEGLPLGVQVVAPRGEDAKLFSVARWLMDSSERLQGMLHPRLANN